jgi:hypothetical protein
LIQPKFLAARGERLWTLFSGDKWVNQDINHIARRQADENERDECQEKQGRD